MTSNRSSLLCCIFLLLAVPSCVPFASAASPSFGQVTVGSSSGTTFGGVYLSNFTSPADLGTITQINVYIATGGTSTRALLYSDNNGAPDKLLSQSEEVSIEGTNGKWVNFELSFSGNPNTAYWLGVVFSSAGTYYYASNVTGKAMYYLSTTVAPSTFTGGIISLGDDLSIYADYTPATPSSPAPQNSGWMQPGLVIIVGIGLVLAIIAAIIHTRRKGTRRTR